MSQINHLSPLPLLPPSTSPTHKHTKSRWVKSLRICKRHSSQAPPQMPDQATLQPGLGSSSENRVAAAGSWLQLKSQLYFWPPASSRHLPGTCDQGNSWAPTSKRKCNRRNPHCHLLGGQTTNKFLLTRVAGGSADCWFTPRHARLFCPGQGLGKA